MNLYSCKPLGFCCHSQEHGHCATGFGLVSWCRAQNIIVPLLLSNVSRRGSINYIGPLIAREKWWGIAKSKTGFCWPLKCDEDSVKERECRKGIHVEVKSEHANSGNVLHIYSASIVILKSIQITLWWELDRDPWRRRSLPKIGFWKSNMVSITAEQNLLDSCMNFLNVADLHLKNIHLLS